MNPKLTPILLDPFPYVGERKLFLYGVIAYLISSVLMVLTEKHFIGLISIKDGANSSYILSFYNNGLAIVLLTSFYYAYAHYRNKHVRLIDTLNVVLISRILLYVLAVGFLNIPYLNTILLDVQFAILDNDFMLKTVPSWKLLILSLVGFLSLAFLVLYLTFLIRGMRFLIHAKGFVDTFCLLLLFFGLEFAILMLALNIN